MRLALNLLRDEHQFQGEPGDANHRPHDSPGRIKERLCGDEHLEVTRAPVAGKTCRRNPAAGQLGIQSGNFGGVGKRIAGMGKEPALAVEAHRRLEIKVCHLALKKAQDFLAVRGGYGADQNFAAGQVVGDVRGTGLRLGLQLLDYFLRVRADQVKGNPKPAVDGPIQQAVGEGKEKTDRHQGKP